ncbi:glutamate--tRNA ligase [Shimazuella kribbensis]|uniref:glutamate--tRNA ligase n=1 Tax=Shimazuella kribbensis TaxID=139808 RepID=UPI0004024905|nr:glutamate--tRNA ligase [Shimazuella kribbensis]
MTVRVRFAPSPTGHLHIGGARTALFNYLFAKRLGGSYILRIEDTDTSRNKADAEEKLIRAFQWLGLTWDEGPDIGGKYGPYRSMERLDSYQPFLDKLVAEEKAYPCFCTKEELEAEREAAQKNGQTPRYSGKCRHLTAEERQSKMTGNIPHTIRFAVTGNREIGFQDHIRGNMSFQRSDIEDFVICKSDGIPTYHFAVTIDDALMDITHVIRGEEHLSNTPKHVLLFEAIGQPVPEFAHIPLILNENGKKLSKRDETILQFIEQYHDLGYLPDAVNNYLALLGWSPGGEYIEEEIFSLDKLVELFSLDRINKAGAIFNQDKLAWVNSQYIKAMGLDELIKLTKPYLEKNNDYQAYLKQNELHGEEAGERTRELVALFQTGMNQISDINTLIQLFTIEEATYDDEANEVLTQEQVPVVLAAFSKKIEQLTDYAPAEIKKTLKAVQKETGFKGKQLFMPIRATATGQVHGPDLNQTLYLLGKEKVLERIENVQKQVVS